MDISFLTERPIAHRGLHSEDLPENGMAAFDAAIRAGYAIETDVRLSKDGKLYLFHDGTLLRMAGIDRPFFECSSDEIDTFRLERKEPIPTLKELLKMLAGRVPLLLEIKNVPEVKTKEFIRKVAAEFDTYSGPYAVQSFRPAYVHAYKKLRPEIPCGLLGYKGANKRELGDSPFWKLKSHVLENFSLNKLVHPDFISYQFSDFPNKATQKFKGVKLAWTVRSSEDEAVARTYADNIIFENFLPAFPEKT